MSALDATWVETSHGSVPSGAIFVGQDKDGGPIYVGRAHYDSDILPAKIVRNRGVAYVSYAGLEHIVMQYEVLCNVTPLWEVASGGKVPDDALEAGTTRDGEALYVGRVFHGGILTQERCIPAMEFVTYPMTEEN